MRRAVRAIVIKDDALLAMHRNNFGKQYYTLVGGAVQGSEYLEDALRRELREETGLAIADPRLVFVEEAGDPYGMQHIYLCDYRSGEVALPPESEEAKIHTMGSNLYTPMWLPVTQLPDVPFLSKVLQQAIIDGLLRGFPAQPMQLHK